METFPLEQLGSQLGARRCIAMIEAKKLAYADMQRYDADPRFATVPVRGHALEAVRGASARR